MLTSYQLIWNDGAFTARQPNGCAWLFVYFVCLFLRPDDWGYAIYVYAQATVSIITRRNIYSNVKLCFKMQFKTTKDTVKSDSQQCRVLTHTVHVFTVDGNVCVCQKVKLYAFRENTSKLEDWYKYADDTELSLSAPPDELCSVQTGIQTCIEDVLSWMNSNKLMLNTYKTEIMAVGTLSRLSRVDCNTANIGSSNIPFKTSVKYLGVKIDQILSTRDQISSVWRASFLELRRLASIRLYLSERTSARQVAALTTSRLDYCSFVLAGLHAEQIGRQQRVQNCAALLVLKENEIETI